jgi:hypothetical protein
MPLAVKRTQPSLRLDARRLPRTSNGQFRVYASDGLRSTHDTVTGVSVPISTYDPE